MQTIKNIWINGCFDILHRGHLEMFKFAKGFKGTVIVGIDSDSRVKELKGETRPVNNQEDRKFFLECIKYVDKVVIFKNEVQLEDFILSYDPDIMIVGSDYKNKPVIGSQYAKKLVFFDRIGGYSTTNILERK
jgi:D-beta-D-heptose 7-phosphate kinase/D-beta-D-heptose 1-phosphate adenosyltransferase